MPRRRDTPEYEQARANRKKFNDYFRTMSIGTSERMQNEQFELLKESAVNAAPTSEPKEQILAATTIDQLTSAISGLFVGTTNEQEADRRRRSVFEICKEEFMKAVYILKWEKAEEEEVDDLADAMGKVKIYD